MNRGFYIDVCLKINKKWQSLGELLVSYDKCWKDIGCSEVLSIWCYLFSSRWNETKKPCSKVSVSLIQITLCANWKNIKFCSLRCCCKSLLELFSKHRSFESFVCPAGNCPGGKCLRGNSPGGIVQVGVFFWVGNDWVGAARGRIVFVGSCPGEIVRGKFT